MSNFNTSADLHNILSGIQGDSAEQIEESGKVLSAEASLQRQALVTEGLRVAEELVATRNPREVLAQLVVDQIVLTAEENEDGESEVYRFNSKIGKKAVVELRTRNAEPLSDIDVRKYINRARDHAFNLVSALRDEAARIEAKTGNGQIGQGDEDETDRYIDRANALRGSIDRAIENTMGSSRMDTMRELILGYFPAEYTRDTDKLDSNEHLFGLDNGYALDMSKAVTFCEETGEVVPAGGALSDWLVRPDVGFGETRKAGLKKDYITRELRPKKQYDDEEFAALSKEYRSLRREVYELTDRINDALSRDDLPAMRKAMEDQTVHHVRMTEIQAQLAEAEGYYASEKVECPEVDELMNVIVNGDDELKSFLWEVAGRVMHGGQFPQMTFGFLGTGGSGKGTFLKLLQAAMGDYGSEINHKVFFSDQQNNPEKVYALMGRLVAIHEMDADDRVAAAHLKKATEQLSSRLNNSNEVYYSTQTTVVITMNNSFQLKHESGVERRFMVVPFGREGVHSSEARLAVEAALDKLVARYGEGWREHPEVQAYVLEQSILGYARMKTSHKFNFLDPRIPAKVTEATRQFFEEADPISAAITELFEFTHDKDDELLNAQISTKVEEYVRKEISGFELGHSEKVELYSRMKELGATKKTTVRGPSTRGRGFSGVRLKDQEQSSGVKLEMNVDEESIAEALKK